MGGKRERERIKQKSRYSKILIIESRWQTYGSPLYNPFTFLYVGNSSLSFLYVEKELQRNPKFAWIGLPPAILFYSRQTILHNHRIKIRKYITVIGNNDFQYKKKKHNYKTKLILENKNL